jgi:nicotinamidase-related amidase
MCCDTTARQAFHRNYTVNFLADATGTLDIANHAGSIGAADLHSATLITQQQRFARVMTTEEWIRESQSGKEIIQKSAPVSNGSEILY